MVSGFLGEGPLFHMQMVMFLLCIFVAQRDIVSSVCLL